MPIQSEKSFRISPVGGFNRQDVMEFIRSTARERQEEIEAYRAGADKLRGERDSLSEQLSFLIGQKERADAVEAEVEQLKREMEELRLALARTQNRLAAAEEENNALGLRVKNYERETEGLGEAKNRAADVEMRSYRRAEEIETEARQNAEKIRNTMLASVAGLKNRYSAALKDSEAAAYSIVTQMDKMRDWFAHFTDLFEGVGAQIAAMNNETQPVIRDFIPEEFDEE